MGSTSVHRTFVINASTTVTHLQMHLFICVKPMRTARMIGYNHLTDRTKLPIRLTRSSNQLEVYEIALAGSINTW